MNQPAPAIAYVAEGRLYTQRPGEPAKLLDSAFVQTILDRVERNRQRNEWKSEGMAWQIAQSAGARRGGMLGMPSMPAEVRRIRFSGVTAGASGAQLLYAIDTDYVGGLFHYDLSDGSERRLYHRNQFRASDLSHHPKDSTLAFTVQQPDGTS